MFKSTLAQTALYTPPPRARLHVRENWTLGDPALILYVASTSCLSLPHWIHSPRGKQEQRRRALRWSEADGGGETNRRGREEDENGAVSPRAGKGSTRGTSGITQQHVSMWWLIKGDG